LAGFIDLRILFGTRPGHQHYIEVIIEVGENQLPDVGVQPQPLDPDNLRRR
jgi:hypothetical protein